MTNITDLPQYVNFSKLSEYNETFTIPTVFTFDSVIDSIFNIFALYPILQWSSTLILFICLFLILRKLSNNDFVNLKNVQIISITSFVVIAVNILLLIFSIFTILQPLEFFFLVWAGSTIISIITKD